MSNQQELEQDEKTKYTTLSQKKQVVIPKAWMAKLADVESDDHKKDTAKNEELEKIRQLKQDISKDMKLLVQEYHEFGSNEIVMKPLAISNEKRQMPIGHVSVVAQVDERGQVSISKEIRKVIELKEDDAIRMDFEEQNKVIRLIILKKEKKNR